MRLKSIAAIVAGSAMALGVGSATAAAAGAAHAPKSAGMRSVPNITGVWERYPSPFEEGGAGFDDVPPPRPGPDLNEPYATEWKGQRAKRQAALAAGHPLVDPSTLCLPEGTPTIMEAIYPIQILQNPGQITVLAELFMQTRRIYIDVPFPATEDLEPTFYGFSSAHWEGNTLVIKTRGVKSSVQFFEIPHSDQMTVTERYQLTGPDMLRGDFTIEDPAYLKTPYRWTWRYKRNHTYRIPEYVCDHSLEKVNPDGTVSFENK